MKHLLATCIAGVILLLFPLQAGAARLTFWTTEIQKDHLEVINFLARAYMTMRDDVVIDIVSVNENDLTERMEQAARTGDLPHLVGADSQLLVALSEKGILGRREATRVIRRIGVTRFYPGSLDLLSAPGNYWNGVPFHGWVQGIWYRADWFEEAGLAPPTTWKAIMAAARRLTDPGLGRYGILIGTAVDNYASQVFTHLARSNDAHMFASDGSVIFDSPATVETLKFYAELAKYGPKGPQSWRARDYFLQGRLAMMFYSTFIMDDLALAGVARNSLTTENFPELEGAAFDPDLVVKVRMAPTIRNARKAGYGVINGFGIRRGLSDAEQRAVKDFLSFLYEPAHYVTWLHMAPGGMMPVLRDIGSGDRFLADPSGIFRRYGRAKVKDIIDGLAAIDTFGVVAGRLQPASSVVYADNVLSRMITRTLFDGVSAEDSVAQAVREIETIARATASH